MADLNQLTLNGERMTEARYPNEVPDDPVRGGWLFADDPTAGVDPFTQIVVRPEDRGGCRHRPGVRGAHLCLGRLGQCSADGAGL